MHSKTVSMYGDPAAPRIVEMKYEIATFSAFIEAIGANCFVAGDKFATRESQKWTVPGGWDLNPGRTN
jgi:hypothetical protein